MRPESSATSRRPLSTVSCHCCCKVLSRVFNAVIRAGLLSFCIWSSTRALASRLLRFSDNPFRCPRSPETSFSASPLSAKAPEVCRGVFQPISKLSRFVTTTFALSSSAVFRSTSVAPSSNRFRKGCSLSATLRWAKKIRPERIRKSRSFTSARAENTLSSPLSRACSKNLFLNTKLNTRIAAMTITSRDTFPVRRTPRFFFMDRASCCSLLVSSVFSCSGRRYRPSAPLLYSPSTNLSSDSI